MTEESSCAVCHQPIPQGRVHYGGVSCYSCRAFFRRNTQREELPVCKGQGECIMTYIDRKQCTACRYDKCIRTGMRTELVLTDDDKKRRFKKLLRKKEEDASIMSSHAHKHSLDDSHDERVHEIPQLEPIKTIREVPFGFSTRNHFTLSPHSSSSVFAQNIYSSKQLSGFKDFNRFDLQKTKTFSSKDKDFLSKLRSEIKNFMTNTECGQMFSQESSSSALHNSLPTSRPFNLPASLSVMVKPVPLPCTASPPALLKASSPLAYFNAIKDIDAWKYLTDMKYLSRKYSPVYEPSSLPRPSTTCYESPPSPSTSCSVSSTSSHSFSISSPPTYPSYSEYPSSHVSYPVPPLPTLSTLSNLSDQQLLHSGDLRPGVHSQADQNHEQQNKQEPEEYTSSSYENIKENHTEVQEELLLNYVHKKFRTHVDNIDKSSENTSPQKRKSVIFHASFSKKICV